MNHTHHYIIRVVIENTIKWRLVIRLSWSRAEVAISLPTNNIAADVELYSPEELVDSFIPVIQ